MNLHACHATDQAESPQKVTKKLLDSIVTLILRCQGKYYGDFKVANALLAKFYLFTATYYPEHEMKGIYYASSI